MTMLTEVCGEPFADQCSAPADVLLQFGYRLRLHHHRIGQINQLVFADVFERNEVRLNVLVEEGLVRAAKGLRIEIRGELLNVVEEFGLRNEEQADVATYWPRLPYLRIGVGPAQSLANHLSAGRH
jgi:hypothetical protein